MSTRFSIAFVMGACLLAAACTSAQDEAAEGSIDWERSPSLGPMEGPIGMNGLSPVDFWNTANQQALRGLGAGALLDLSGDLASTSLLDTEGGRSVLSYAVQCGLAEGNTVERDGFTFEGRLGLAPGWASQGLTTSEQRWMTACLLQHLNGLGANVPIMLVGSHAALDPLPGVDVSDFTVPDATAFGNLFASTPKAYICSNLDLNLVCGIDLNLDLLSRLCGLSPTCGVSVLNLCLLSCSYGADGDPSCGVLLGGSYPEAIATHVEETSLPLLHPLCD